MFEAFEVVLDLKMTIVLIVGVTLLALALLASRRTTPRDLLYDFRSKEFVLPLSEKEYITTAGMLAVDEKVTKLFSIRKSNETIYLVLRANLKRVVEIQEIYDTLKDVTKGVKNDE